jgi:hypothetical protein
MGRIKAGGGNLIYASTFSNSNSQVEADRAFQGAERLRAAKTPESLRKALEKYEEALKGRRATSNRSGEALTLNRIESREPSLLYPLLESTVASLVGREAVRQIAPSSTRAKNPQYPI